MQIKLISDRSYKFLAYSMIYLSVAFFIILSNKAKTVETAGVISLFIVANMLITSYKRFLRLPVEIELLTIGIVICTLRYGLKAGLVVAILGGILGFISGLNFSPFSLPMLLGYISMAFLSFLMSDYNITLVGVLASLLNNTIVFILYIVLFNYDIFRNISFSLSNMLFNIIMFLNIVPMIARILP